MGYQTLQESLTDLEAHGHLVRIGEEVNPVLEMASIHLRVHQAGGPAVLFENVKGSPYKAVSNMFGTMERARFMFRDTLEKVQGILALKSDPLKAMRSPFQSLMALKALPRKVSNPLRELKQKVKLYIEKQPDARVEYVGFFDEQTMKPAKPQRGVRMAVAAFIGKTRLIDNARI